MANRWNSKGLAVIYTASSRALACLENLAHFVGEVPGIPYQTMLIDVPDTLTVASVDPRLFPAGQPVPEDVAQCRELGNGWLRRGESAVLRVPSVLVPNESNYLLNPAHPDFARIQLVGTEDFRFDSRLKE